MKPRVQQKLDQVFRYPFFESVGKPLPDSVTAISDWKAAIRECSTLMWANSQLMARNAIQAGIERQYPNLALWERFQEWNPLCEEARPLIISFVDSLLARVPVSESLRGKLRPNLQWDFLLICIETEFIDIAEPVFYLKYLDPWYKAGHFPCGWDGDEFSEGWDGVIDQGKLIVF
jgi:hypothetical protein